MTREEYHKLLRNPEWVAFTQEHREYETPICNGCGRNEEALADDGIPLQLHHLTTHYRDKEPWKYPHTSMRWFCRDCHCRLHGWITANMTAEQEKQIAYIVKQTNIPMADVTESIIEWGLKSPKGKQLLLRYDNEE